MLNIRNPSSLISLFATARDVDARCSNLADTESGKPTCKAIAVASIDVFGAPEVTAVTPKLATTTLRVESAVLSTKATIPSEYD